VDKSRGKIKSVFNTYIDMISFVVVEEQEKRVSERINDFSEEEKAKFFKMASSPTIRLDLARSFAPSICGHENIKKGLLAQLFGGTKKIFEKGGRGRFRSDINICLLGDPSTAKSQLLQQVHKIAARSIYTSGRGSSAVGLTANVRKDPDTKEFVL
jgi:DNA replication licensing factor MCM4